MFLYVAQLQHCHYLVGVADSPQREILELDISYLKDHPFVELIKLQGCVPPYAAAVDAEVQSLILEIGASNRVRGTVGSYTDERIKADGSPTFYIPPTLLENAPVSADANPRTPPHLDWVDEEEPQWLSGSDDYLSESD